MSLARDPSLRGLDACRCCQDGAQPVPMPVENRPGLSAVAYRIGTHGRFLQSLLAGLSDHDLPELARLRTRGEDFTIALLDAWSVVADVLTFYQERIANESYLRTARERRSLIELARLTGYTLRPGVAAGAYLAFTLEDAPGAPGTSTIPAGTRVQSIPAQDQVPQSFETSVDFEAHAEWNALRPRLTRRQAVEIVTAADVQAGGAPPEILLAGVTTGLKTGDRLLLIESGGAGGAAGRAAFQQVRQVVPCPDKGCTRVLLVPAAGAEVIAGSQARHTRAAGVHAGDAPRAAQGVEPEDLVQAEDHGGGGVAYGLRELLGDGREKRYEQHAVERIARARGEHVKDIFRHVEALRLPPDPVVAFRARAAIFGHNAPGYDVVALAAQAAARSGTIVPDEETLVPAGDDHAPWVEDYSLADYPGLDAGSLVLDGTYPSIVAGSYVALLDAAGESAHVQLLEVAENIEVSQVAFTLTGRATRIRSDTEWSDPEDYSIRGTSVYGQNETLRLARVEIGAPLSGSVVELDGLVSGLRDGQTIIVEGERHDMRGVRHAEAATLARGGVEQVIALQGDSYTCLHLTRSLDHSYVRASVTINANAVHATHGESVDEVLGSGDGTRAFQEFVLRQAPLTYLSSDSAAGAQSTLEVRANGVLWQEVENFYGRGPDERVYTARLRDDGGTVVQFGDGVTGARLPSGQENVRARYRKGIGQAGLLDAGQIALPVTRPLGVRGVTNKTPSVDAADSEGLDEIRANAGLHVLTLGRVVSLQDYEDFARAFPGIAKARATWTREGQARKAYVTIAGPGGRQVLPGEDVYEKLLSALKKYGSPNVPVDLRPYQPITFSVAASLVVEPGPAPSGVASAAQAALRDAFSFERRAFGQDVAGSEVIAVLQSVPGVQAVTLTRMRRTGAADPGAEVPAFLAANTPEEAGNRAAAAELLTLDPAPIALEIS